jgi:uncharacterized protein (TIGR03382 family)
VHLRRHLVLLLSTTAFGSTGAWASDIQCATTRQPAERVICDHAILDNEYDDIFAQQRALLSSGKLSPQQLAEWRRARNACTDVHCIDTVFARWKTMARSVEATSRAAQARAPAMASSTEMAPVGPASDAMPSIASPASPTSEASLVRHGSAAGVALPQPVATQAASPAVASAASSPSDSRSTTGMSASLIVALLVAIGFGVLFRRRKK